MFYRKIYKRFLIRGQLRGEDLHYALNETTF